ncbi:MULTISPECIES: hypothetical protein [unclassified Streptomyces]
MRRLRTAQARKTPAKAGVASGPGKGGGPLQKWLEGLAQYVMWEG